MSPEKLAHMANQIGRFFITQKQQDPVASIADHILKFWDPRMREAMLAGLDNPSVHLDAPVRAAMESLKRRQPV
jgi:formate dehydrogenase subunit delta